MLKKLLILLLLPLFFSACTKETSEVITFSSWGSVTETKIITDIINRFEKENPNIKVQFMHIPQNYFQKIHLLFASSTPPDVIFINNLYLPVYSNELEDLGELINVNEFYPQTIESMSIDGKLLAVPRDVSNFVFYYNKNLIPNIGQNWSFQDFENILNKNRGKNFYPVSFERDIFMMEPYIMTLGEVKGTDFYKKLEGTYAPTPAQVGSSTLAQMFLDEKLMLYLSGRWMYPKIKETATFPWGIVPFPGVSPADASGWAISKNSKHKESAKTFVKYISSKDCIEYIANTGLIVPARKDVKYEQQEVFTKAINQSRPHTVDKNYRKTRDTMNKELFE